MLNLRYALRQPVRSPGFTAVALLTLTLGMGANTAFFSVLYGVVLRQPPYPGAGRPNWLRRSDSTPMLHRMLLPLGLLMAAASSVLLIACVNVAIMSLLRALARRREISIRLAIGATRRDVIRQLVTEASVLCTLGALGGLLLARVELAMLKAFAPGDIPRLHEAAINVPAALFTSAVLVLVTLLVGLAPALVALRMNAFEGAIPTGRSSDGRTSTRLRDTLTVVEIALAASRLVCAGLTLRSVNALARVDLGFATEHRFTFKTNPVEHLFLREERLLAERAGDIGHHLRLDSPDHRQVGNDREPSDRSRRQRKGS